MPKINQPKSGSLGYWPRKRVNKFLPSVNWHAISSEGSGILGFIGYKAGMKSAFVKDNTQDSMTKGKRIVIPVTIIECPTVKIFSIRFYKNNQVVKEILALNLDKELKRRVKLPKTQKNPSPDDIKDYDDIRIIIYSQVKKTGLKKIPDVIEVALSGSLNEKLEFVKEHNGKEISIGNVFKKNSLVDIRGLTKGHGFSGPVKRFGISLKSHKSEKGVRRPGSLGPWHPARVMHTAPQAGQLGMFTRPTFNHKIIEIGSDKDLFKNIENYGNVKNDYILLLGSIPGPEKRQVLVTSPLRATKKQLKKNYELIEVR